MRYAIWNNKGGVGKTFLTFAIATSVAQKLKDMGDDRKVVVIDMCPQANVSEILLGGNGSGSQILADSFIKASKAVTVAGYFETRVLNSPYNPTGDERHYARQVSQYNEAIPDNIYLIAGDPALELQIPTINMLSLNGGMLDDAWIRVHSWVSDLIKACKVSFNNDDTIFFIDCNPSFSVYTELALVAAERLIVPCSPDGSSARAVLNVARLVYGYDLTTAHEKLRFSARLEEASKSPPKMHLFVSNRGTLYAGGLAKSFGIMAQQLKENIRRIHSDRKDIFSEDDMEKLYYEYMPDAHSIGVVMSHLGLPLDKITPGSYDISAQDKGADVQVHVEQKEKYQEALDRIIDMLGLIPDKEPSYMIREPSSIIRGASSVIRSFFKRG